MPNKTDDLRINAIQKVVSPDSVHTDFPSTETARDTIFEARQAIHNILQGEDDRQATTWKSLPRAKKKDPVVIGSFVKQLIAADKNKEAEDVLRKALLKKYSQELMYLYGKVKGRMRSWLGELF